MNKEELRERIDKLEEQLAYAHMEYGPSPKLEERIDRLNQLYTDLYGY